MIDFEWQVLFKGIADNYGYTFEQIGSMSFAQLEGLLSEKKRGKHMTAEQINELAKRMKERHGVQTS
jgi:hypothetical protein